MKIKGIIIGVVLMVSFIFAISLVASPGPNGETISRTIEYLEGNLFSIRLDVVGAGDVIGIIKETKPSSCEFFEQASWQTDFDIFNYGDVVDISDDLLEFPFIEDDGAGYFAYFLICSEGGFVSGEIIWEDESVEVIGGDDEIDAGSCWWDGD